MRYWLNLDANGRVLSAAGYRDEDNAPESAVIVDTLPNGDVYDYIFTGGSYVYDPVVREPVVQQPTETEKLKTRVSANEAATAAIMDMLMGGM